jgi:exopolyphosphatase/pppGpp-phosphohydrolase
MREKARLGIAQKRVGRSDMQIAIHQQYRTIRLVLPAGTPITVLHIGEQETAVVTGAGAEPEKCMLLEIGSRKTAADFFLHTPPSPGEIENAIMQVEDEITRVREMIAGYAMLVTMDASIREIALIAGIHAGPAMQLPVDDVEQAFSLLASYSLGRPASISGIPGDPAFAATLLILREFMHHLKFTSISVRDWLAA